MTQADKRLIASAFILLMVLLVASYAAGIDLPDTQAMASRGF